MFFLIIFLTATAVALQRDASVDSKLNSMQGIYDSIKDPFETNWFYQGRTPGKLSKMENPLEDSYLTYDDDSCSPADTQVVLTAIYQAIATTSKFFDNTQV